MRKIFPFLLLISVLFLSGCAAIWIPKKQKITFITNDKNTEVYLDNDSIGAGEKFISKVDKSIAHKRQIVLRKNGYKDEYAAIIKTHRPPAYYPLATLSILCFVYQYFLFDGFYEMTPKLTSFEKVYTFKSNNELAKLLYKKETEKYVYISNIKANIKEKDFKYIDVNYSTINLEKNIELSEKKLIAKEIKAEAKAKSKEEKKKKTSKKLEPESTNDVKLQDTKYSDEVYKTLKKTGYIDTINKVFRDVNNSLVLEASINQINQYNISNKWGTFYRAKVFLTWYIKNAYDEIIDSVKTNEFSGDFPWINNINYSKMIGNAIDFSYNRLHQNPVFIKQLELNKNLDNPKEPLSLIKPIDSYLINDNSDAGEASVIVKTKENGKDAGHGSGFAISQDGYILTNYHVIAGKTSDKIKDIVIVTSSGKELTAQLIRANKYRDIALLKIDNSFEKVFELSNEKKFKKLQDIYTIGAPKSVELGQSVSSGIISNLRENNNSNPVLQLGMSVNGGNSGGPVFDKNGNLHGVIQSKLIGNNTEGVSFAIPAYLIPDYLNINFK